MAREDMKPLDEIADRMLDRLAEVAIDKVWARAGEVILDPVSITKVSQHFSSKKALAKAIGERDPLLRAVALPLLAGVDKKAAAALFAELIELDLAAPEAAPLAHGVGQVWSSLASTVPIEKLVRLAKAGHVNANVLPAKAWDLVSPGEVAAMLAQKRVVVARLPKHIQRSLPVDVLAGLWLDGTLSADALPDEARRRMPLGRVVDAWRLGPKAQGLAAVVKKHEELQTPTALTAFLEQLVRCVPEVPREAGRDAEKVLYPYELEVFEAILEMLGKAKHRPASSAIRELLAIGDERLLAPAIETLRRIGTDVAAKAGLALLERAARGQMTLGRVSAPALVRSVLERDPAHGASVLAAFFAAEALGSAAGAQTAGAILGVRARAFRLGTPLEPLFEKDPGWLDLGVRLLGVPGLDARAFLASFDHAQVVAAMARAGWKPTRTPAPMTVLPPAHPRWLERYKNGEHEAVWSEIRAMGPAAGERAVAGQAQKVAHAMMARVRKNLERIVAVLVDRRYPFAAKAKDVLSPPGPKTEKVLADLERALGAPLPVALRAFYEVVGSVSLAADADAVLDERALPFEGFGALDPLVVVPPKASLDELRSAQKAEARYPAPLRASVDWIYLGQDPRFKAEPRVNHDDHPYVLVVGQGADGLLTQGPQELWFVDYLRRSLSSGGFFALAASARKATRGPRELLSMGFLPS